MRLVALVTLACWAYLGYLFGREYKPSPLSPTDWWGHVVVRLNPLFSLLAFIGAVVGLGILTGINLTGLTTWPGE